MSKEKSILSENDVFHELILCPSFAIIGRGVYALGLTEEGQDEIHISLFLLQMITGRTSCEISD